MVDFYFSYRSQKSLFFVFLYLMNRTVLKKLSFVGAPISLGQKLAGVKKGPQTLRKCGLFEALKQVHRVQQVKDHGDVSLETLPKEVRQLKPLIHNVNNLHLLNPLLEALSLKIQKVFDQREKEEVILNVGGDHSVGSATIHAALKKNPNLRVLWVDAHADFVNPYLKNIPNQNYHGMPLSHISGVHRLPGFSWMDVEIPFRNIVLIGIRDLDCDEFISLKKYKVKAYTMDHIDNMGIGKVMTEAMNYLDPNDEHPFHISFDVDAVDPSIVNQTGTVFRDGLSHRQACHIVKRVVNERQLVSMDIVQINPDLGSDTPRPRFRSQEYFTPDMSDSIGLACDLITSLASRNLTL